MRRTLPFAMAVIVAAIVGASPAFATEGHQAIAFLNQQRTSNGIPSVSENQELAAAWCPQEDGGPNGGDWGRALSEGDTTWSESTSPWHDAPLHQAILYNPLYSQAGDVDVSRDACFSPGAPAPEPSNPTFYVFISETGNDGVPFSENAAELPYIPQQIAGIPASATTGPNIILYSLGFPLESIFPSGAMRVRSSSLRTAAGAAVPATAIDEQSATSAGFPDVIEGDSAFMVPPILKPVTAYEASVTWEGPTGATATQSFSFSTEAAANLLLPIEAGLEVDRSGRRTGWEAFQVRTDAPNATLTAALYNGTPRRVRLRLVDRAGGIRYFDGRARLAPGVWQLCVTSGGATTGYAQRSVCRAFRVR